MTKNQNETPLSPVYMMDDLLDRTPADTNTPNLLISFDQDAAYTFYMCDQQYQFTELATDFVPTHPNVPDYYSSLDRLFTDLCAEHQGLMVGIFTDEHGTPSRRVVSKLLKQDITGQVAVAMLKGRIGHASIN